MEFNVFDAKPITVPIITKMDSARAQYIMGFSSNRWVNPRSIDETKATLDNALLQQMKKISIKQKTAEKEKKDAEKSSKGKKNKKFMEKAKSLGSTPSPKLLEYCSKEYVTLHEAYQFLVQKHVNCNDDQKNGDAKQSSSAPISVPSGVDDDDPFPSPDDDEEFAAFERSLLKKQDNVDEDILPSPDDDDDELTEYEKSLLRRSTGTRPKNPSRF